MLSERPSTSAKSSEPPPRQYESDEVEPLSVAQVCAIIQRADDETRTILLLLATSSMRPQDVWPLRLADVDRERAGIRLQRFASRDERGGMYIKARGKSKRSRRFVPLVDGMIELLDAYAFARSIGADDLLFPDANGRLQRDYNFTRRIWKPLAKSIGRLVATLKVLRHRANSFMADLGISLDVRAAILGNSAAVNTRVYTHINDTAKREAMGRIAPLFAPVLSTSLHPVRALVGDKRGTIRGNAGT